MILSDKLTPREIQIVLHRLGIKQKGSGWITIKSPLREEKTPSFGINLDTGAWKDHATGDTGDIVTLAELILNKGSKEAIQWIKEQTDLAGASYGPPKSNGHTAPAQNEANPFWTRQRKQRIIKAQQHLKKNADHPLIKQANSYDCLTIEPLQLYGVGLVKQWHKSWLTFPYETGCQLYRRSDGTKVIRSLKGSSPGESFFGSRKVSGDKRRLILAKSPRETILLHQLYGNRGDVVGLATGEQPDLSKSQIEWLKTQISDSNYSGIIILLDCDNEGAESIANGLADKINQLAGGIAVSYVNLHEATRGDYKDIADCTRTGMSDDVLWDLVNSGNEVKETPDPKAIGNNLELELDLSTAPPIPPSVYDYLPEMLKTRCSLIQEQHRRDVFLVASLPAIAAQMPNVWAEHRDRCYSPDLFTLILAGPGSGKGEATRGRALGRITDKKIREEAEREIQDYESKPDEEKATVLKPKKRSLFVPANASSRKMLDRLEANGGSGFIFETEIDTLINATKQDWGNYTDTVRKSFQHEPVSIIRTDGEYYLDNPRLSMCLTGTFDQFKAMFESAENGHFSRYAFYTFDAPIEWISHQPTTQSRGLRDSIKTASQYLYEMHQRLKKRDGPLYIDLDDDQWKMINDTFGEKMQIIETLGLSKHLHGSNNRTAIIALRLASIFTVLRANEKDPHRLGLEDSLTPTQADMNAAIMVADIFIKHAIRLYYKLPKSDNSDAKGLRFKKFISALPKQFKTAEAIEIAERLDIPISTAKRWLSEEPELERIKRGHYKKLS